MKAQHSGAAKSKAQRSVTIQVRGRKRQLLIRQDKNSAFDKKVGVTTFKLLTEDQQPIGAVMVHRDGSVGLQRAKPGTTVDDFELNMHEFKRANTESALKVAARWYNRYH